MSTLLERPLNRFQIYIHIDPKARKIMYVGKSQHTHRPFNFRLRGPAHEAWLQSQITKGYSREHIVHVVCAGLKAGYASYVEIQLIAMFQPIFNVRHNGAAPLIDGKYRVLPVSALSEIAA